MNIFITVGTTPFDSLYKVLDDAIFPGEYVLRGQIGNGRYKPKNFDFFEFDSSLESHLAWADAVITHAGAGSVFSLLEDGKKCLVVANLERQDKHQAELADYVVKNGFALATHSVEQVPELALQLESFSPAKYEKIPFFMQDKLTDIILSYYE
ncbi:MAG: PssE/Cps14G family polysaccharide biosynthesis glycosyltransferase [Aestuariibacter sp.]